MILKVFISADIEGVGGVMGKQHWDPDGADYKRACAWMVEEVNAAVQGALDGGAAAVVVKDSHNNGTNIELDRLHPQAELISGWGPLGSMVEGLNAGFDAVFLVGYHARAATVDGTLAHTWSSNLMELRVDGRLYGETGWAAVFAGHFGVPVVLVTGDDKLAGQVREELPEGVRCVVTKTGWAYNAARMRPLLMVRKEIHETAKAAMKEGSKIAPLQPKFPCEVLMRFRHWEGLNACAAVPGVERRDATTFVCRPADAIEAQKYFATLHRLARPS